MPYVWTGGLFSTTEATDPTGDNVSAPKGRRHDDLLNSAFPGMPKDDNYDHAAVATMRAKLLNNTIGNDPAEENLVDPRAQAHIHWGGAEADFNMSYEGAPNTREHDGTDSKGNPIASAFVPNLLPPTEFSHGQMGGADNPVAVVPPSAALGVDYSAAPAPESPADNSNHAEARDAPPVLPAEGQAGDADGNGGDGFG